MIRMLELCDCGWGRTGERRERSLSHMFDECISGVRCMEPGFPLVVGGKITCSIH